MRVTIEQVGDWAVDQVIGGECRRPEPCFQLDRKLEFNLFADRRSGLPGAQLP